MKACSADTGISLACLKRLKNSGSKAFRNTRIDLGILIIELADKWMYGDDRPGGEVWLDPQQQKARNDKARADKLEIEISEMRGELYREEQVIQLVTKWMLPVRQRIQDVAAHCSSRCNPEDPDKANGVLTEWSNETFEEITRNMKNTEPEQVEVEEKEEE